MAMVRPKVGERIEIESLGTREIVTVTEVWEHEDEHISGFCIEYVTDRGMHYHKFVIEREDYSSELKYRSGMPYHEYAKAFKWDYYGGGTDQIKSLVNSYVEYWRKWREHGRGLYICSEVNGSGKTFLACCIGNEIIKRYNSQVCFVTVNDYIGLLTEDKQKAAQLRDSVLLIVDDIGAQNEKQDWIRDAIFRLVDYRYRTKLPTIYTSNMPLKQASKNDRVASRMFERSHELKLPEISVREILATQAKAEFLKEVAA